MRADLTVRETVFSLPEAETGGLYDKCRILQNMHYCRTKFPMSQMEKLPPAPNLYVGNDNAKGREMFIM